MDMKLYEVTKDIETLLDEMEFTGAGDSDREFFSDTMEGLQLEWEKKAEGVSYYIGNLEANVAAIKNAEKNMADRRKSIIKKVERLKTYLIDNMDRLAIEKIETPHFVAKIKKNPPKVVIHNEEEIPEEFWEKQVKWVINKTLIKSALKREQADEATINVKGAELKQERRLEIK